MIKKINSVLAMLIAVSMLLVPLAAANEGSELVDESSGEVLTVDPNPADRGEKGDTQTEESDAAGEDAANAGDALDEPASEEAAPSAPPIDENAQDTAEDEKGGSSSSETDERPGVEDSADTPRGEPLVDDKEPPADLEAAPQGLSAPSTAAQTINDDDPVVTIIITGNGEPLPYAYFSLSDSEDYLIDGSTDEAGVAELSVPAGTYSIWVSGYQHYEGTTLEHQVVDANNSTFNIDLVARPTGTVQILCADGCSDHANASVNIRINDDGDSEFWFASDINLGADGQGAFLNVPAAQSYDLIIYPHGVFTVYQTTLAVTSGQTTTITPEYKEGPSGSVTFSVAHGDEAPITRGVIQLWGDVYTWAEFGESGTVTLQLPVGEFEYEAFSDEWAYERESGRFEIEAGVDITVPIVFSPWPTVSVTVLDVSGNPIGGVEVGIGYFDDEGSFFTHTWIHTDSDGTGLTQAPASGDSWRVQSFGLWHGGSGKLTADHTTITLDEVTQTGVVTFAYDHVSVGWPEITLTGENGWRAVRSVEPGESVSMEIPAGSYQWSASIGWTHHFQEGSFEIANGEETTIELGEFEAHPEFTVSAVNQLQERATGVSVYISRSDGSGTWTWLDLDDSGMRTSSLPYGDYLVDVYAPAKYQPLENMLSWTFSETSNSLEIELTELPNDDLRVQINYNSTQGSLGRVWVQDSDENLLAEVRLDMNVAVFSGLPHGDGYTLHTGGTWWHHAYKSEPFDFNENTEQPMVINLESLEPVELTVIASPADGTNRLPMSESLQLTFNDGWYGSSIHLSRDDANGTLSGTITVPKRAISIDFYGWTDFYTSEDLPHVVDLTTVAGNEHVVHLTFVSEPHGLVTFDLDVPEGVGASGEIQIARNGDVLDYLYIYEDQTSVTTYSPLIAGDYTWRYVPQGAFVPTGGEFTIVDRDVSVPVQVSVGENGVIIVTTSFPEGIDDLETAGYVYVYDSNQRVVASRDINNLSQAVAVGPVLFGDYSVQVTSHDGRILRSAQNPVTVGAEIVELNVTLAAKPILEPRMVRFEVASESGDPVIGGEIYTDAEWVLLDENGHAEMDTANYDTVRYQISSQNFETHYGEWVESDGNVINIELTAQRPVLELAIINEDNEPVSGLDVYSPDGARYLSEGVYILSAWDPTATSMKIEIRDYSGVYLAVENEVVELDGMFTHHTVTVVKAENVASNVTLSVEFEGEFPALDEDRHEEMYITLSSTSEGHWLYGFLDTDGNITFADAREGVYDVYLSGFAERWLFDDPDPATVEITESDSTISVQLNRLELVSVTFMIETSDGTALDLPAEIGLAPSGSQFAWRGLISEQLTVDIPAGEYRLYVSGAGEYRYFAGNIEVDADTGVVIIPIQRIAAIPVAQEPEPPVTETPTPTATVTPTPAVTPPPATTPTPVAPGPGVGQQSLIVAFETPGGASIAGAPYSLYAPMASQQFMLEPFWQGVVGPDNTIEVSGLVSGNYRLVVMPLNMPPIDVVLVVGDVPVTEAVVMIGENGGVSVSYLSQRITPTPSPDETSTSPAGGDQPAASIPVGGEQGAESEGASVTGLPSTGAGQSGGFGFPIAAMIVALMFAFMMIPHGVMKNTRSRR